MPPLRRDPRPHPETRRTRAQSRRPPQPPPQRPLPPRPLEEDESADQETNAKTAYQKSHARHHAHARPPAPPPPPLLLVLPPPALGKKASPQTRRPTQKPLIKSRTLVLPPQTPRQNVTFRSPAQDLERIAAPRFHVTPSQLLPNAPATLDLCQVAAEPIASANRPHVDAFPLHTAEPSTPANLIPPLKQPVIERLHNVVLHRTFEHEHRMKVRMPAMLAVGHVDHSDRTHEPEPPTEALPCPPIQRRIERPRHQRQPRL